MNILESPQSSAVSEAIGFASVGPSLEASPASGHKFDLHIVTDSNRPLLCHYFEEYSDFAAKASCMSLQGTDSPLAYLDR